MTPTIAGKPVGPVGLGMIPLLNPLTNMSTPAAIALLKSALQAGSNFWNASLHYGTPEWNSLHLLREYFIQYPEDVDKVVVCVKAGFHAVTRTVRADAEGMREAVEEALRIAGDVYRIDVLEAARLDPDIPVEETVGAIAEFARDGRVGGVGISECSAASLRRAAAVTPIALAELELSLFSTTILTDGTAEACAELGVPIVAYSPLGRGFLTGTIRSYEDLGEKDFRRTLPRFSKENFGQNLKLVEDVEKIAERKGCTTGQVALAWVVAQGKKLGTLVMPIPGTSSAERLRENLAVVELTEEEMREIDEVLTKTEVKGERYPAAFTKFLNV